MSETLKRPTNFPRNFSADDFKSSLRDAVLVALDKAVSQSGAPFPEQHGGAADADLPTLFKAVDAQADRLLERAGWTHVSEMLPHTYVDASQDLAAYMADVRDYQAITVAFAYKHGIDEPLSNFVANDLDGGHWQSLSGIDVRTNGDGYTIEFGRTGEKLVPGSYRIFTSRKALRERGLPPGEPGGPAASKTKPD